MATRSSYEIHLASDVISLRLDSALKQLGFERDRFIGGTTGVVHPCHYTADPADLAAQTSLWTACVAALSGAGGAEFHGYAEAEITAARHRIDIPYQAFDATFQFPFERFVYEECPFGSSKKFDVHISVDLATLDYRLKKWMEDDFNFHYVDIAKPAGQIARVYTIQPFGPYVSADIWEPLVAFFTSVGGFQGKIKLEVCRFFERFPADAQCCPVVTAVRNANHLALAAA